MSRKMLTFTEFLERAQHIHGKKFDYSKVKYKNSYTKVIIYCKKCKKAFEQTPNNHLAGKGCPYCKNERISKSLHKSQTKFIKEARKIHGNKYDYSLVEYKNNRTPIKIICKTCKTSFLSTPGNHLAGKGCTLCGRKRAAELRRFTTEEFIKRAKAIYGNKYDYSETIYHGADRKVKIKCNIHNLIFFQRAHAHLKNTAGCPKCKTISRGEALIIKYLKAKNIKFIHEKIFLDCKYKAFLRFDFYLPDYNTCIEYQGIQHYEAVEKFGGEQEFILRKKRDKIKRKYCKEKSIKLLEIKYNENIEEKIQKMLVENNGT